MTIQGGDMRGYVVLAAILALPIITLVLHARVRGDKPEAGARNAFDVFSRMGGGRF